uniref:Uncharacterized protein n=1 Tax=Knipowitschia caucasica TaxID=637954 RepID=A0AAV2K5F3_KNICA
MGLCAPISSSALSLQNPAKHRANTNKQDQEPEPHPPLSPLNHGRLHGDVADLRPFPAITDTDSPFSALINSFIIHRQHNERQCQPVEIGHGTPNTISAVDFIARS